MIAPAATTVAPAPRATSIVSRVDLAGIEDLAGQLPAGQRIKHLLKTGGGVPRTIEDIALALDISEDAVGYALRLLRTAGLVQTRKVGRTVFYRLVDSFPEPLLEHCLRELIQLSRVAGGESTGAARSRHTKTRKDEE